MICETQSGNLANEKNLTFPLSRGGDAFAEDPGNLVSGVHWPSGPARQAEHSCAATLDTRPARARPAPGPAGPIESENNLASRGADLLQTATTLERLGAASGHGAVAALA